MSVALRGESHYLCNIEMIQAAAHANPAGDVSTSQKGIT